MIKTYKEALEIIFKKEGITKYSLDNIKKGLNLLGNPQNKFKIVHVAGTNGKGSVCQMVFSILKENNEKVGIFTSPHLLDIKERFETEAGNITDNEFVIILNKIINLNVNLSYFDKCVLIAFEFFKLKKSEYVILEVGVGGRLDTTNIVNSFITSIVSVGMDHQNILGNSLDEISFEKAGIIKKKTPLVLNIQNDIINKQAELNNANIIFTNNKYSTNLLGEFQKQNAGLAYEITKYIGISDNIIFKGLQNVRHKGRLQFVKNNILVDAAHNEDSLKKLKGYINENLKNQYDNIFYCFSIKKGKNIELIIDNIGKNNNFILLNINSDILEDLSMYSKYYPYKTKEYILEESIKNENNLYVIFGSLYMIGNFLS